MYASHFGCSLLVQYQWPIADALSTVFQLSDYANFLSFNIQGALIQCKLIEYCYVCPESYCLNSVGCYISRFNFFSQTKIVVCLSWNASSIHCWSSTLVGISPFAIDSNWFSTNVTLKLNYFKWYFTFTLYTKSL